MVGGGGGGKPLMAQLEGMLCSHITWDSWDRKANRVRDVIDDGMGERKKGGGKGKGAGGSCVLMLYTGFMPQSCRSEDGNDRSGNHDL